MKQELINLSNHLDSNGFTKEADFLDGIIRKIASENIKTFTQQYLERYHNTRGITDTFQLISHAISPRVPLTLDEARKVITMIDEGRGNEEIVSYFGQLKDEKTFDLRRQIESSAE